jgi:hypothetical protein
MIITCGKERLAENQDLLWALAEKLFSEVSACKSLSLKI